MNWKEKCCWACFRAFKSELFGQTLADLLSQQLELAVLAQTIITTTDATPTNMAPTDRDAIKLTQSFQYIAMHRHKPSRSHLKHLSNKLLSAAKCFEISLTNWNQFCENALKMQQFCGVCNNLFTIGLIISPFQLGLKKSVHTGDISNTQTDAECLAWWLC